MVVRIFKKTYNVYNRVWKEGKVPEEWKKSILVIKHKKGAKAVELLF